MRIGRNIGVVLLAVIASVGCQDPERGLTSRQTDQMLVVQEKLAAERTLVAAEHAAVGRARDELEKDRRELARRERREPIVAKAIESAAMILACSMPLLVLALVVLAKRLRGPSEAALEQVRVELLEPQKSGSRGGTECVPKRLSAR